MIVRMRRDCIDKLKKALEAYPDNVYCTFMDDSNGGWRFEEGKITGIDSNNKIYISGGDQLHRDGSRFCIGRCWYINEDEVWRISKVYNKIDFEKL